MTPAEVRAAETVGPVLIHVVTEKGRGYIPAETSQDKMHGVVKFDPKTGKQYTVSTGRLRQHGFWMVGVICVVASTGVEACHRGWRSTGGMGAAGATVSRA